ncbi:CocE/NonD family hydrolase [Naasia lichenicola]|uniref:CocE/NonD family hydrolase n=1 Tax=Naasia lichenicola TaxID=2565933 RepID=A0A4S4FKW5_9MICO|nr:CocE/NonD family hydrolase [Naasia lichenicola]
MEYPLRPPRSTPESRGAVPLNPRQERLRGMIIDRDVVVTTRAGRTVVLDVYRPENEAPAPAVIAWSPYGKHNPAPIGVIYPESGVRPDDIGELTTFEAPDPDYWVPFGYSIVIADIPGTWNATGPASFISPEEAEDYYDLIEWAGTQPWSNGKVGLSGVSYLTVSQWRVAELNPPHLAAINPWEGWSDTYREVARHGGIPETSFWPYIWERWGASRGPIEDLELETAEHPWFDDFWQSKASVMERITVPAWVVGSWSDQGLHSRGTLEGFRRLSSSQKWLDIHGRKKWGEYYLPANVERQRQFFDRFLKGEENGWEDRPPVLYEVRERYYVGETFGAESWPLPDTAYTPYFLGADGTMSTEAPRDEDAVEYDGRGSGLRSHRAEFEVRFTERTEIVGHAWAELQVSAPDAEDMDLFVGLFKKTADGEVVGFPYYAQFEDGPVAVGWLRVSHRELDPERSHPFLPVLAHQRALPMEKDGPTSVTIEILPSGTVFEAGESLVFVIQGRDIMDYPPAVYARHHETANRGRHLIHVGGAHASRLVLPVIGA